MQIPDGNKFCVEANDYAAKITENAKGLFSDAGNTAGRLDAAAELAFDAEVSKKEAQISHREKEVAIREAQVIAKMAALEAKDIDLQNKRAKLVSDQVEFDSCVKAYIERFTAHGP